jgi:ribosomal protein S18 acetylase RimI-like enzyme
MAAMELARLETSRLAEAAQVLSAAFCDTPVFGAVLGGSGDVRRRKLARVFGSFAATNVRHGDPTAVLVDGRVAAVSLVFAPGAYPLSFAAWARNGLGALTVGPRATWKLARVDGYMQQRHFKDPHFYLFVLGVDPSRQGQGHGGALLRALNARADQQRMPCYLETDDRKNVGLYERFGYVVTDEGTLPGVGLPMWLMLRPAT